MLLGTCGKSVTKKFRAILRGERVLYVKKRKRKTPNGRHYKTSIFPPFPSQNSGVLVIETCGLWRLRGVGVEGGKTGRFRYFRSWDSLRGHGAVASSAVEVLSLGRDGGPAIVLHGLGCRLGLLGLSP
jgi:hypothetical protein